MLALFLIDMRIRYILLIVPSLVVLCGLWHLQYVPEYQAAGFSVRLWFFFAAWHGAYLWRYVQDSKPVQVLDAEVKAREAFLVGRCRNIRPCGTSIGKVAQHGQNLSSISRPQGVLLRAGLFS